MVRAFPVRSRWLPVGALIGALAVSACTSAGGLLRDGGTHRRPRRGRLSGTDGPADRRPDD